MRRLAAVSVAAVTLAVPAAASADAPWSAPRTVGAAPFFAAPAFTPLPGGTALLTYGSGDARTTRVSFAPVAADATIGAPVPTSTSDTAAAVRPIGRGRVLVVSLVRRRVPATLRVRTGTPDGRLGRVANPMPGRNVLRVSVAANTRGEAVIAVVTQQTDERRRTLRVVRRTAAGRWTRPETIVGRGLVNSVSAAIDAHGRALVAYDQQGSVRLREHAPRARGWDPVRRLTASGPKGPMLRTALRSDGRGAVAILAQRLTEGGGEGSATISVAARRAGGRYDAPQVLERYRGRAPDWDTGTVRLALGLDAAGTTVAWTGRVAAGGFGVRVARTGATRFSAPQDVSPPGRVLNGLATGSGGGATVVFGTALPGAIGAAVRPPGATAFASPGAIATEREAGQAGVGYAGGHPVVAFVTRTGPTSYLLRTSTRGG